MRCSDGSNEVRSKVEKEASSKGEARDGGGLFGHTKPNAEHQLAPGNVGGRSRWSVDRYTEYKYTSWDSMYILLAVQRKQASISEAWLDR